MWSQRPDINLEDIYLHNLSYNVLCLSFLLKKWKHCELCVKCQRAKSMWSKIFPILRTECSHCWYFLLPRRMSSVVRMDPPRFWNITILFSRISLSWFLVSTTTWTLHMIVLYSCQTWSAAWILAARVGLGRWALMPNRPGNWPLGPRVRHSLLHHSVYMVE